MKHILAIIFFSLTTTLVFSQDLTGVWRGSFYSVRDILMGGSRYRYEVQIDNKGKGVKGVTYSYQSTRFYGKASLIGMWTPSTQNLVMKEEKMEDLKIEGGGEGCLMTCYLDYRKEGDKEYLEGTYTSRNMNNGTDCGGGKVFLERVIDSDFEKEDFLKKKEDSAPKSKVKPGQEDFLIKKTPPVTKKAPAPVKSKPTAKKPAPKKPATTSTAKTTPKKTTTTPAKKPAPTVAKTVPAKKPPTIAKTTPAKKPDSSTQAKKSIPEKVAPTVATAPVKVPAPPVLKQRKNELFQTIATSARQIIISFYDNGEIDGDTISVYDNNKLLVRSKGLTAKPITVTVNLDENDNEHEIVMVAENLGSIPPNTALMIVQAGSQRYTVRLSSTEQKNAMVRFRYEPD
jgi:hypothetical protein